MRFYLDEDLSPKIVATALQRFALVVESSHLRGMNGLEDEEQLAFATRNGWCIVTNNRDDFLALDRRYRVSGIIHAGILIIAHSLATHDFLAVARALAAYHAKYPESFIPGLVDYLHVAHDPLSHE